MVSPGVTERDSPRPPAVPVEHVADRLPEQVVADATDQPHALSQAVQGEAGVGDRAAGRERRRADFHEPTGLDPHIAFEPGNHVEADVPGDDDRIRGEFAHRDAPVLPSTRSQRARFQRTFSRGDIVEKSGSPLGPAGAVRSAAAASEPGVVAAGLVTTVLDVPP